jgi:hypothetical protein
LEPSDVDVRKKQKNLAESKVFEDEQKCCADVLATVVRHVHVESAAIKIALIHGCNCRLGVVGVVKRDKSKSTATAGLTVGDDNSVSHGSVLFER